MDKYFTFADNYGWRNFQFVSTAKEHHQAVKRYCCTLDLRNNAELIAEYRRRRDKDSIWKEVLAGIREVGIFEMEIYILDTRLFMMVETPIDFDWDRSMERMFHLYE